MPSPISNFIDQHFLQFNEAALLDAAKGNKAHIESVRKMMITLDGAMSTAEHGKSMAEIIRQDKVQIISCTGATLEEDLMTLVAHSSYQRLPNYRDRTPEMEYDLLQQGLNRVTDTCIPEEEAFRKLQCNMYDVLKQSEYKSERYFPHEYMYELLMSGTL